MLAAFCLISDLPLLQGELEQLLLSEDPGMAERQCHFQSGDHVSKRPVLVAFVVTSPVTRYSQLSAQNLLFSLSFFKIIILQFFVYELEFCRCHGVVFFFFFARITGRCGFCCCCCC